MKRYLIFSFICLFLSVIFTLALVFVDVRLEGIIGTNIGLASLNLSVARFLDRNLLFYKIAEYLGYLCFAIVAFYGIQGLIQLIRRKSFYRVDKRLLTLASIYLIIAIIYVVFDKVFILNYRPVFIGSELESSFPSSHTLMALVVCVTSFFSLKHYVKNSRLVKALNALTILLALAIVAFRTLSGTHWITDIIASALYSATLIFAFLALNTKSPKSAPDSSQSSHKKPSARPRQSSTSIKQPSTSIKQSSAKSKQSSVKQSSLAPKQPSAHPAKPQKPVKIIDSVKPKNASSSR